MTDPATATTSRIAAFLGHNEAFARDHTPLPLAPPTARLIVLTCLDHRVDPAAFLGLRPGDAPVLRNAGGRVTPSVVDDLAYLAFLARRVFGLSGPLFEVAVIHHTQCGTGFLADDAFRREAAAATGLSEPTLAATEVADPFATVRTDVDRLLHAPLLPREISASGHVYDLATGRVTTVVDARHP
ncbi:carbonic anhydrase [Streptacidiphilus rugosus]|uniref:carbonic anhydrase n=1 Tax=Streptacidiphilus rugosus TaxID=405783 RepID=UPI0005609391|nr:carbonic anhydrase [Streptacidiphilus rugosus]